MALMDFIKKQFIDIIQWTEDDGDTMAWRFPMAEFEIQHGASLSGHFTMERGALAGVDLDRVLQDRGNGDEFRFESLRGNLAVEGQGIELSALNLLASDLKAGGTLSFDAARAASGRLALEARSAGARRGANLKIGGTLAAPHYQR